MFILFDFLKQIATLKHNFRIKVYDFDNYFDFAKVAKIFRFMQEKRKNISQVKQRILQFVEIMNIKKEKFYQETSLCGANFRGKSAESELSCDKIAIILRVYDDLNPDWLLLGKGEMLRSEQQQQEQQQPKPQQPLQSINQKIDYVSQLIDTQNKYIHALEAEIKQLKEQIEQLKK